MILADTSVWIDHLRNGRDDLAARLSAGGVLGHPYVRGELAAGQIRDRAVTLRLLAELPPAEVAESEEVFRLIEVERLFGLGLSWVDLHLLAATRLTRDARLHTLDRRLQAAVDRLGIGMDAD
ncbi:MAG: type II toxin-antitoxin system VapC family toxin [Phenylobacterium sp.]